MCVLERHAAEEAPLPGQSPEATEGPGKCCPETQMAGTHARVLVGRAWPWKQDRKFKREAGREDGAAGEIEQRALDVGCRSDPLDRPQEQAGFGVSGRRGLGCPRESSIRLPPITTSSRIFK